MTQVNIHEAKTHLSRLIERAAAGETVIIAKAGKAMVRMVPIETRHEAAKRRVGFMEGEGSVPDDFDTMFADEIKEMFYGPK